MNRVQQVSLDVVALRLREIETAPSLSFVNVESVGARFTATFGFELSDNGGLDTVTVSAASLDTLLEVARVVLDALGLAVTE